jgi:methylenetetrahydrofolate reductase (NADPH)
LTRALAHPRFELIPIKGVEEHARHLPPGAKVTVTCSATRGLEETLLLTERLAERGLEVVPHISARLVVDEAHLRDILRRLADLNLREIFVIGGDAKAPAGPFSGALDLLRAVAHLGHGFEEIGVAAYPEYHPFMEADTLRRVLEEKQPFATYMVTQICFDSEVIARWLGDVRERGINLPVHIGIPGVVDTKRLLGVSLRIGVGDSTRFLLKHTNMVARLLTPRSYQPDELVDQLAPCFDVPEYNIRGLHINTFNQIESTEKWRQEMLNAHRV